MSLRQKLILISVTCLVLPTVLLLYISNLNAQKIIEDQTLENSVKTLTNIQSQVNAVLDEMISISNSIIFDTELMNTLVNAKTDPRAARKLTIRLQQVAATRNDLHLTLLLTDGRYYSDYSFDEYNPQLFYQQDWFSSVTQLATYETFFIGPVPDYLAPHWQEPSYVLLSACVLMDDDSIPFAYLIISRSEKTIRELHARFQQDIYLLNTQDQILSSHKMEQIGQNINSFFHMDSLQSAKTIQLKKDNQLILSEPLQYPGWRLVSIASYEQMTQRLKSFYRSGQILQVLLTIGFLLALTFFLRRFTMPIQVLADVANKVEAGNLDVRSHIRGIDDVGKLGRSFDQMLTRIQKMIGQIEMEQELKRRAELAMLQMQIHPHFLFNVLSSIRMRLLMKDDLENAELLGSLSTLLRQTISNQQELVTLHTELENVKQYTQLMNFAKRFPLATVVESDPELLPKTVPRFILQPIVENAYKHGFRKKGGTILIRVERIPSAIRLRVEDDGLGISPEGLENLQGRLQISKDEVLNLSMHNAPGIGLSNVYGRLKLIYGERFQMNITSELHHGTVIELIIPDLSEGEEHA
nr:sensor histidine kinase [Paenibacillus periandrae]